MTVDSYIDLISCTISCSCFAVDDLFGEGSYGKDKYAGTRDGCYGKCLMRFTLEIIAVLWVIRLPGVELKETGIYLVHDVNVGLETA